MSELPKNIEELDEKQKEQFIKLIDEANKNQQEFLEEYRRICKQYKFDFIATPVLVSPTGKELDGQKFQKVLKSINRILFNEHVGLKATFKLIPRQDVPDVE